MTTGHPLDHRLADIVGPPVTEEVLKDKPGRRRTTRVTGSRRSAIVKTYASDRATVVATRVAALAGGPPEPTVPTVLALYADARSVVLMDVPGSPLGRAVEAGDLHACHRAGAALARWHHHWQRRPPQALRHHGVDQEITALHARARTAPPAIAAAVHRALPDLAVPWPCTTAVHRDLYEEQILVDQRVGLIDLDDAAAGPPELDIGNLLAHLRLAAHRLGRSLTAEHDEIIAGYLDHGPALEGTRLAQCESLARLRLACIHAEPHLLDEWPPRSLEDGIEVNPRLAAPRPVRSIKQPELGSELIERRRPAQRD
jgi:Ser/Thr protein kinase RdoA (MazF antagonist)